MKIDFKNVRDLYKPGVQSISKGPNKYFCPNCRKTLDQKQFFKTSRIDKHPSGFLPECKTCLTMTVDDTDPATFLPILKEINMPYIPGEWRTLLSRKDPRGSSILGKYVSKMRLNQFKKYSWEDSERLTEEESSSILDALRQQTNSETEAEQQMNDLLDFKDLRPVTM